MDPLKREDWRNGVVSNETWGTDNVPELAANSASAAFDAWLDNRDRFNERNAMLAYMAFEKRQKKSTDWRFAATAFSAA